MSECLQEKSSRVDVVPLDKNDVQSLPGIKISLEEQCKDMYGPNAVLHDPVKFSTLNMFRLILK